MKLLLLLGGMLYSVVSLCQSAEKAQIQQWQSKHPEVIFISTENFNALSTDQRKLLGLNTIVFEKEITLEKLLAFDNQLQDKAGMNTHNITLDENHAQFIKDWLGIHQDVRVITQSRFQQFAPERQVWCSDPDNRVLVLSGEMITRSDIENSGL